MRNKQAHKGDHKPISHVVCWISTHDSIYPSELHFSCEEKPIKCFYPIKLGKVLVAIWGYGISACVHSILLYCTQWNVRRQWRNSARFAGNATAVLFVTKHGESTSHKDRRFCKAFCPAQKGFFSKNIKKPGAESYSSEMILLSKRALSENFLGAPATSKVTVASSAPWSTATIRSNPYLRWRT